MPTHSHRVRYHECDAQGFLFNSRHLEMADVAMTEWLRQLGWSYDEFVADGADVSVVRAEVDYRLPIRFDEVIDLTVTCLHVGTSSLRLGTRFCRGEELVASTELVYVNLDVENGGSRPLPESIRTRLLG